VGGARADLCARCAACGFRWLPGLLRTVLEEIGFREIELPTRVVVFAPELAASYFAQCGRRERLVCDEICDD
jgi:hypothetical protein